MSIFLCLVKDHEAAFRIKRKVAICVPACRDMVGSENILTMPLPAEMHLPLSELQKQSEEFEYSELLNKVLASCPCSYVRPNVNT